ncbi:hypothetical protein E5329_22575 [Petralouisia muris]|uniref:Uncharacterized protein n=1 Tax=Petralouisia muris TaxID=3032872 RepID=A0AC61RQY8_9FIRM|nr:PEP/pyruvate-binding domain-containing protein [Petralouisia muris]TGY91156.1 hypothetical protein E5329_22575 [Petralouisia muris]
MIKIVDITEEELLPEIFGGKAAGLSILKKQGFLVPDGVAIEAVDSMAYFDQLFQNNLKMQLKRFETEEGYEVAVRSSCTMEDIKCVSGAGKYKTFLGQMSFSEIWKAIEELICGLVVPGTKMGIVIQRFIQAQNSGVIFTSDPFTYEKNKMLVSFSHGLGDKLVSGKLAGRDVTIRMKDQEVMILEGTESFPELKKLCMDTKQLECRLGYPLDIEWAADGERLYYLQCRPISTITSIPSGMLHVDMGNMEKISERINIQDRIDIWKQVLESSIEMPDTYIYIYNDSNHESVEMEWELAKSAHYKGYSAVVLYPNDIVGCHYLGDKTKVRGSISKCCRYGIRAFPQYGSLKECIRNYDTLLGKHSWIGVTMIQETVKPLYTGQIRKIQDGYLMEITYGNFVTKGIVPVNRYMIGLADDFLLKKEVEQTRWYELIEGHIVYCLCNEDSKARTMIPEETIVKIVQYFKPLLETRDWTIEFGIFQNEPENEYQPFFMDLAEQRKEGKLTLSRVSSGIISEGKIKGKIIHIEKEDISLLCENLDNEYEPMVFFAQRPDIALLPLVERCSSKDAAFVFCEGSVLCHLATVLREKRIPAIQIGYYHKGEYAEGKECVVNAQSEYITGRERISVT